MTPSRRRAITAHIEVTKQSSLVVEETTKHWRRNYEAYHAAMTTGSAGRMSRDAVDGLYLLASASYEALLDAMRVHAGNLYHLKTLKG